MSDTRQAFSEAYAWYKQYAETRSDSDRNAFHRVYREAFIKFARKMIPYSAQSTLVATDLVNDTFLKLEVEALAGKQFATDKDLQRYALTVIRNRFLDYARSKNARRKKLDPRSLDDMQLQDYGLELQLLDVEALLKIDAAVRDLERYDAKAALIALHYIYGAQDKKEIAETLNVHPAAIRRALLKLGARLQAE